jgi:hypothetical protein
MFARNPAFYCGPMGQRCTVVPPDEGPLISPPKENGIWVDGLNTFVYKGRGQGLAHIAKWNAMTIPPKEPPTDEVVTDEP